jgi:hypothetical protein
MQTNNRYLTIRKKTCYFTSSVQSISPAGKPEASRKLENTGKAGDGNKTTDKIRGNPMHIAVGSSLNQIVGAPKQAIHDDHHLGDPDKEVRVSTR